MYTLHSIWYIWFKNTICNYIPILIDDSFLMTDINYKTSVFLDSSICTLSRNYIAIYLRNPFFFLKVSFKDAKNACICFLLFWSLRSSWGESFLGLALQALKPFKRNPKYKVTWSKKEIVDWPHWKILKITLYLLVVTFLLI